MVFISLWVKIRHKLEIYHFPKYHNHRKELYVNGNKKYTLEMDISV